MSLVVEDGTGITDAESFISVAFVTTYVAQYRPSDTWSDVATTSDMKERACRQATQYLETKYAGRWSGDKVYEDGALSFPRFGVYDLNGILLSDSAVPVNLQRACAELAIKAIDDDLLVDVAPASEGKQFERIRIGPIEESTSFAGAANSQTIYPLVEQLLKPLLSYGGGGLERG